MTVISAKMKEAGYATHQVGKWNAGMATPDHTPKGRGFDFSLNYFHHANSYYNETEGMCNMTKIVDLWDTDKPASDLNGTGTDHYEEVLFKTTFCKLCQIMILPLPYSCTMHPTLFTCPTKCQSSI